jgi:hypothetical protein
MCAPWKWSKGTETCRGWKMNIWIQIVVFCVLINSAFVGKKTSYLYNGVPTILWSWTGELSGTVFDTFCAEQQTSYFVMCLEAFVATEFNKILSCRQPRQGALWRWGHNHSLKLWRIFTPWHVCLSEKILMKSAFLFSEGSRSSQHCDG